MARIYIDPGHGGSDPGAIGHGLQEKNLTLTISKYARTYLLNNYSGVEVRMSRTTDKYLSLGQRTNDANKWGATILVSVHINAGPATGTGYEDFIYNGSVSQATRNLQNDIHAEMSKLFSGFRNRGKKRANFHMLRESRMPAVLPEFLFITNKQDADFLKSEVNLKRIGEALAKAIAKHQGLKAKVPTKKPTTTAKPTPVPKPKPTTKPKKTISQMAKEVIAGKHGSGHDNRRKSLGISKAEYEKVRAEVNKISSGGTTTKPKKSISQMATEVIAGKHGSGHENRRKSLGISKAEYEKVRAEVNRRL